MSFSIQPWRLNEWFPFLSEAQNKQFQVYASELMKFAQSVNLVSAKSIAVLDLVHFADCILASKMIHQSQPGLKSIADIGSGNGFPGLVFGIMYPEIEVHLIEPDQKKAEFLKHVAQVLNQKNIQVFCKTIESLPEGSVPAAVSRGFAQLSKALITTRRSFMKNGTYYHMKGDEWSMEVSQIPTQLCSQWDVALLGEYKLPSTDFKLAVVKTSRIG